MIRIVSPDLEAREPSPRPTDPAIVGLGRWADGSGDLAGFFHLVPPGVAPDSDRTCASLASEPDGPSIESSSIDPADPLSRLLIETARSALSDAGLSTEIPDGRACRLVLTGRNPAFPGDRTRAREGLVLARALEIVRGLHPDWSEADFQAFRADLRGRTAPKSPAIATANGRGGSLDLGPASFVEKSAESGLLILARGAKLLRSGRADLVVAAEVDEDPNAPDNGAVSVVVMKRLADAERDGDRIYAVVRGFGKAGPEPEISAERRRSKAIRRAYRRASIGPETIGLIGSIGAGSGPVGAFFPGSDRRVIVPSVRAMDGVIRAALALHHRVFPPPDPANARDEQPRSRCLVRPWFHGNSDAPRRAAVDVSGGSRACGHAILEAHESGLRPDAPGVWNEWDTEAILIGAPDRPTWLELARSLLDWIDSGPAFSIKDLAYTLNVGQPQFPFRVGLVASSARDLRSKLRSAIEKIEAQETRSIRDARGIYFWEEPLAREGSLAFLFPGEGSQYPGMLADLCPHFPEVSALFDTADRVALERGHARLPSDHLIGAEGAEDPALWAIGTAINVVLTSQWALYQVLIRLGLRPKAVVGHSSGEFLALGASGALRIDRRFEDEIGSLGSTFEALDESGSIPRASLLAVAGDRDRVRSMILDLGASGVSIAIDNCPHQVVLAGPPAEIDRVEAGLRDARILGEKLPFDRAYHTAGFEPAIGPIRSFLDRLAFRSPRVPIYSCATAGPMPSDPDSIRELAATQWARPVAFRETIESMHAEGVRLFVEVGARGNLTGFVEDILRDRRAFAVAANLPRRSGLAQLNHLVASLFAHGVPIRPGHLYARRRPVRLRFDDPDPPAAIAAPIHSRRFEFAGRVEARPVQGPIVPPSLVEDPAILAFRRTMEEFRETQEAVLSAYLQSSRSSAEAVKAGPWIGEIRELDPGRSLRAVRRLRIEGDPVAEEHTLGGRRISTADPALKGLPVVPFAVMAEILAQAAAVLRPGRVVVGFEDLTALRWLRYEEGRDVDLEILARSDASDPDAVHARICNLGSGEAGPVHVCEGVVRFAESRAPAPEARPFRLEGAGRCRFVAEELYSDQWLFHGPAMRGLVRVGDSAPGGIEGTIRVAPRRGLLGDRETGDLLTDVVALDVFTHLLGCWGLDRLDGGDVIFPLRLARLEVFGDDPAEGTDVACRIEVREVEPRRVRADAEIVRPDGSAWMRLTGWEDWRFHWPSRFRDVFRAPDRVLLGEPIELPGAGEGVSAVWLEPPGDFGRPVWRDVLEWVQLGPAERREHVVRGGSEAQRSLRLWGRIAAKEAARRLWLDRDGSPVYPADLAIDPDSAGRPKLRSLADPSRTDLPGISIGHVEGVAVALATLGPGLSPGIDVVQIEPRGDSFEAVAFSGRERAILDRVSNGDRDGWVAQFWAAKEAAAKATGSGLRGRPDAFAIHEADPIRGVLRVLRVDRADLEVKTAIRGGFAWAWTVDRRETDA